MICRITGRLTSVDAHSVVLEPPGGLAYLILTPAYSAERLASRVGSAVTLHTLQSLEPQGQGSSFIPRTLGFESESDRRFFEVFTTVKGVGTRKAMRAMSVPPAEIAMAINSRDAKALQALPEIGKRLAETIIAELSGKVSAFLGELPGASGIGPGAALTPGQSSAVEEAVAALVALGQAEPEARRLVDRAARTARTDTPSPEELVALAFGQSG